MARIIVFLVVFSSANSYSTPILATTYFNYWSTILGDVFGGFDFLTGAFDWIAGWVAYRLGDSPHNKKLRAQLHYLHEDYLATHKEELARADEFWDSVLLAIQTGDIKLQTTRIMLIKKIDELEEATDDDFHETHDEHSDASDERIDMGSELATRPTDSHE